MKEAIQLTTRYEGQKKIEEHPGKGNCLRFSYMKDREDAVTENSPNKINPDLSNLIRNLLKSEKMVELILY